MKESHDNTHSNIESLVLKGGGEVIIEENGNIKTLGTIKKSGKKLIIENTSNNFNIGNNFTFNNRGSVFQQGNYGSIFQSGNSVFQSGNSVIQMSNGRSNRTIINGVEIDLSRLNEISVNKKDPNEKNTKDPEEKKSHKLDSTCCINSITINGSSSIHPIPLKFINLKTLQLIIKGSGDIFLPYSDKYNNINIVVQGSGDINGNNSKTEIGNIVIQGSGDVSNLHIKNSGSVTCMGSGDVVITADNPGNIIKNKMGSGNIKIR